MPKDAMMVGHIWSFLISWRIGAQNFQIHFYYLEFCFFHSFSILGNGQGIDHGLDVTT